MYVFDLLCTCFCLITILLYASGKWLLAIPAMWLAYKSKELAIMLPLALAAYELWFGKKKWMRLLPFLAISLLFGIQAGLHRPGHESPYRMIFAPASVLRTLPFYSSRLLLVPFAGVVFVLLPFFLRDRRVRLGGTVLGLFFLPLLFLPGRMYPAYTYLPLTGAAIEFGALAGIVPVPAVLAFFALWVPWNVIQLRMDRRTTLTVDDAARSYVSALMAFARTHPKPPVFVRLGSPASFQVWGLQAALRYEYHVVGDTLRIIDEKAARAIPHGTEMAFINYDPVRGKTVVLWDDPSVPRSPYIDMNAETPVWQLGTGWFPAEGGFRWMGARARATVGWPVSARRFQVVANINPAILSSKSYVELDVVLDGHDLGHRKFNKPGVVSAQWDLPVRSNDEGQVEIVVDSAIHIPPDPRLLGVAIVSFGMVTR